MTRATLIALLAVAGAMAGLPGCGDDHGFVEGQRLVVAGCGDGGSAQEFAPFRLELISFGLDPGRGPLYIRAQGHGEPLTGTDGFLIAVQDADALSEWRAATPDAPVPFADDVAVGDPVGETPIVRGSLLLAETCPDSYVALELAGGAIVFESLGTENSDRVRLRFEGATIRDMRTGETVGEGFGGEMDFEVRAARPYRWHNP